MLTCNINIEDRLVTGLVGKVMRIGHLRNTVKVIYVKFDDQNAGLATMQSDIIPWQQHLVPILKYEVYFPLKKRKAKSFYLKDPISISFLLGMYSKQGARAQFKRKCYNF